MSLVDAEAVREQLRELCDDIENRLLQILAENEYPKDVIGRLADLCPAIEGEVALDVLKASGKSIRKRPGCIHFIVPVRDCEIRVRCVAREADVIGAKTAIEQRNGVFTVNDTCDSYEISVIEPGVVLTCEWPRPASTSHGTASRTDNETDRAVTLALESVYSDFYGRAMPRRTHDS